MRQKHQDQGLIPAVGYIRMSTDDQKDSPERQRGEIVALAQREGYQIIRWYEDHGLTGTESKNRPGFLKLMADLPKREFKTVLMYEQSRFSREDVFDAMAHWKVLKDSGVTLVTVQRGEMRFDDLAGLITAMVGQHEARSESIRIAERSISGRKLKAAEGKHVCSVPFGFDREIYDESGKFVRRVTYAERFRRPKSWTSKLVPSSDPKVLDGIRFVFQAVQSGTPMNAIARHLNELGLRTRHGKPFCVQAVRVILKNPAYVGLLRFGHRQVGKFAKAEEQIVVPDAHEAIIGHAQFDRVNEILRTCYRSRGDTGEAGRYILSRLVYCGHCGKRMGGKRVVNQDYVSYRYQCTKLTPGVASCPRYPTISGPPLEALVLKLVAEYVLCEANRETFREVLRNRITHDDTPSPEQGQLMEIRLKIERAEDNMAECDGADLAAIRKRLASFREREQQLVDRIRQSAEKRCSPAMLPFASADELKILRDNLHRADKRFLAVALGHTIQQIVITDSRNGRVDFVPGICEVGSVGFNDGSLRPKRGYIRVAEYVNSAGRAVGSEELANALGGTRCLALHHGDRAAEFGLLTFEWRGKSKFYIPKPAETPC
jgi:DNA invertase Pin-like site-specific DNA recombinase